jgi:hypothetical protein
VCTNGICVAPGDPPPDTVPASMLE